VGTEWVNVCKLLYTDVSVSLDNVQQVLDTVSSFKYLDTSRVTTSRGTVSPPRPPRAKDYGDDDDEGLDQSTEQSGETCDYIKAVRCNNAACYGSSFRLDTLSVCPVRASQCTRVAVTCTECLYGVTILFVFIIPGRC